MTMPVSSAPASSPAVPTPRDLRRGFTDLDTKVEALLESL